MKKEDFKEGMRVELRQKLREMTANRTDNIYNGIRVETLEQVIKILEEEL